MFIGIKNINDLLKIASVQLNYAGQKNCFRISKEYGYITGYVKDQDFPNEKFKEDRGEIWYVEVFPEYKNEGKGKELFIEALDLIKSHGSKTVNISIVSEEGEKLVESILRDGYISGPIKTSETGKAEYTLN